MLGKWPSHCSKTVLGLALIHHLEIPSSGEIQALHWVLNLGFNGNETEFTTGIPDSCWNDQRHIKQVKLAPGLSRRGYGANGETNMDFLLKFALSLLRKGNSKLMKLKKKKRCIRANKMYQKTNMSSQIAHLESPGLLKWKQQGEQKVQEIKDTLLTRWAMV